MAAIFAEDVDIELVLCAHGIVIGYLDARTLAPARTRVSLDMDITENPAMNHILVVIQSPSQVDEMALAAQGVPCNILDHPSVLFCTPHAQPHTKTAVTITMPAAVEYPCICTYPGHFQATRGILVATAS